MRRRIIITTALGAIGLLALSACSPGGGGGGKDSRGDITIWYSNNEAEIEWGKQMVEAWNADNPDEQIKAQEIPAGESSEATIARRSPPATPHASSTTPHRPRCRGSRSRAAS